MLLNSWQQQIAHHVRKLADFFPVIFFFAGFLWDALTLGRTIATTDLYILSAYLLLAALVLYTISRPSYILSDSLLRLEKLPVWIPIWLKNAIIKIYKRFHFPHLPYFLLQFIYGNLLSALFILYFKSANHWLAWLMALILGVMLVANEYLEDEYKQFTLSWALFGFCAMLLFNFALPFLIGSIHALWFYLSTLLGAGFAYWLYKKTPEHFGSITPVWLIAVALMLAYSVDMIPPVPLVKRDIAVGYALNKIDGNYQLTQQAAPWWIFWRTTSNDLQVSEGQRVYCFASVFAPRGLTTKLYHRWQYHDDKKGWQTLSRTGFTLSGGRDDGFRGYTYKQSLQAGDWKVSVETENEKTVTVIAFHVNESQENSEKINVQY